MKTLNVEQIKSLVKSELNCGDCRGLTKAKLLPNADKVCGDQGQVDDGKICEHFRSNVYALRDVMDQNGDSLVALFEMFGNMDAKTLRTVAGMLLAESKTRKHGFKMGQPVFVRYRGRDGRDYMNNFMAARILDVDDKEIRIISEEGDIVLTYPNDERVFSSAIFTKEEFAPMRASMIEKGRLIDPEKAIKTAKRFLPEEMINFSAPSDLDGFAVPMMNEVVKGKKKRPKKTNTLVDIVDLIDSGYMMGDEHDEDDGVELSDDAYQTHGKATKVKKVGKGAKAKAGKAKKVKAVKKIRKIRKGALELGDL